jgi:hypothetical protein
MEEMILDEVHQFVDHLRSLVDQPLEVESQLNLPILNTLCRIALGDRFEYTDQRLQGTHAHTKTTNQKAIRIWTFGSGSGF